MSDQRRRHWAGVVWILYKYFVFAGQEDFPLNIVLFSNVDLMFGQRRRRWPNIKTAFGECLVGVASIVL